MKNGMKSTLKLTKAAKILIALIIVCVVGVGTYFGISSGFVKTSTNEKALKAIVGTDDPDAVITADTTKSSKTINLSLDEWIG